MPKRPLSDMMVGFSNALLHKNIFDESSEFYDVLPIKPVPRKKLKTDCRRIKEHNFREPANCSDYNSSLLSGPSSVRCQSSNMFFQNCFHQYLSGKNRIRGGAPGQDECKRKTPERPKIHTIKTPEGCVEAEEQLRIERTVERDEKGEHIHRKITTKRVLPCGKVKESGIDVEQAHIGFTGTPDKISVTDIISKGQGYTEHERLVEHYKADDKDGPCLEKVARMVQEESDDVDRTQILAPVSLEESFTPTNIITAKTIQQMRLKPSVIADLEKSLPRMQISADEEQEELEPEVMAAMLHAEEKGTRAEDPPNYVYNSLFAITDATFVDVSPVGPGPMAELVVPVGEPEDFIAQLMTPELQEALYAVNEVPPKISDANDGKPVDDGDIYSRTIGKEKFESLQSQIHNNSIILSFNPPHHATMIEDENAPWLEEDMTEISHISGALPSRVLNNSDPKKSLDLSILPAVNELENSFEFITLVGPPKHFSRVQIRGSDRPTWFPGYFVSLPGFDTLVKATANPNNVLPSAWKAVQPLLYEEEGSILL